MPTVSTDSGGNRPRTFVDTNVLVYAHDASDPVKQALARAAIEQLWADGTGILSTQVLQEFYVVVTGRQRIRMPSSQAREILALYGAWRVVQVDLVTILAASELHETHSISFWDALIVQSARMSGAARILTEDVSHGTPVAGIRIENPFLAGR